MYSRSFRSAKLFGFAQIMKGENMCKQRPVNNSREPSPEVNVPRQLECRQIPLRPQFLCNSQERGQSSVLELSSSAEYPFMVVLSQESNSNAVQWLGLANEQAALAFAVDACEYFQRPVGIFKRVHLFYP